MGQIKIQISNPDKIFTPVFNHLWGCKDRFIINYGGTASGKSFSAAQKEILKSCEETVNILVIRKVGSTLKDSVMPSFMRRISEFKLQNYYSLNKSDRELTNHITKSKILFRGLDDPEKMKSIEGITRILVEEASELDFEDYLELNRRVRGMPNIQITLTFNPIHEKHWLKTHFFDNDIEDCTIIHSTYKDNPFITDKDREQIEQMRLYDYNQYRVYALGEWGVTGNKNPWLFHFKQEVHVGEPKFLNTYPVYLSFDFNREPVSCLAFQQSPNKGDSNSFIHCIKEFAGDYQLEELCTRILTEYPISILFVTGDATGNRGNVGFSQRHATYYTMIKSHLSLADAQMNVPTYNLEHNDSRNLCNAMLAKYPSILIHKDCTLLLADIYIATVDEKKTKPGVLLKDRKVYKMDVFDCWRYFFQTYYLEFASKVYLKGITRE